MRERDLRLATGLILAVFVVGHLLSHSLGIVSHQWLEVGRKVQAVVWQNPLGTLALYGALLTHLGLGVRALYRRRTLHMPAWEAMQLGFGLAMPLLLAGHVVGTRLNQALLGFTVDYPYVVALIWTGTWPVLKQCLAVGVVWIHVCIGLHFWLRLKPWYSRLQPWLFAGAVALPLLALLGFLRAGLDHLALQAADPGYREQVFAGWLGAPEAGRERVKNLVAAAPLAVLGIYLVALIGRHLRIAAASRQGVYRVHHSGGRVLEGRIGQTILETLRTARLPHASVCGGRARCTTCRVRVGQGIAGLPDPSPLEAAALTRIGAPENVRLACQVRPREAIDITPVLPADAGVRHPGGVQGREQRVAAMFVDLRGSTALGERKLPYDVVFVLNRFFEEMSAALTETRGHYAQFAGDGLMALYGLEEGYAKGCRSALEGAVVMTRRLAALNERLHAELDEPLRIGIGVHAGEAIVGTMGPPTSPNFSAVGDNINIAARLEQQTKSLGCVVLVSADVAAGAGIDLGEFPAHDLPVRGREAPVRAHSVEDPEELQALLTASSGR